jgi:hypothetical protein
MRVRSEFVRLMALVTDAREGRIAPSAPSQPWSAAQVEALWENILNDWPVGPLMVLDGTHAPSHLWRGRIGPHPVRPAAGRRLLIAEGAEKLGALAWSLVRPEGRHFALASPEEQQLWGHFRLVLDAGQRRARFVADDFNPRRQLPVRLLPDAAPCLLALNAMEVSPVEREWLNAGARKLLQAQAIAYLLEGPGIEQADQLLANYRRINERPSAPARRTAGTPASTSASASAAA